MLEGNEDTTITESVTTAPKTLHACSQADTALAAPDTEDEDGCSLQCGNVQTFREIWGKLDHVKMVTRSILVHPGVDLALKVQTELTILALSDHRKQSIPMTKHKCTAEDFEND